MKNKTLFLLQKVGKGGDERLEEKTLVFLLVCFHMMQYLCHDTKFFTFFFLKEEEKNLSFLKKQLFLEKYIFILKRPKKF